MRHRRSSEGSRERCTTGALLLLVAIAGCARKAPGPDECRRFAVQWTAREVAGSVRHVAPDVAAALERRALERTTRCLTTPYDRELVECVAAGSVPRDCFDAFRSRMRAGAELVLP